MRACVRVCARVCVCVCVCVPNPNPSQVYVVNVNEQVFLSFKYCDVTDDVTDEVTSCVSVFSHQ